MSHWLSLRCLKLIILSSDIYFFFCVLHGIVTMHWISQAITLDINLTPPLIPSVVFFLIFYLLLLFFNPIGFISEMALKVFATLLNLHPLKLC